MVPAWLARREAVLLAVWIVCLCACTPEAALPSRPDAGVQHPATTPASDEVVAMSDTRAIRAFPERYLGQLVDCELRYVGPLRSTPTSDLRLRELGLSHTRDVRCSTGFVQLGFRPTSSALAAFVRPDQSVRARVLDAGGDRFGVPVLNFVVQREATPSATPPNDDALFAPLEVGADLRPAAIGRAGGAPEDCVVAWVGTPHAPAPPSSAPAAADTIFHAPLSCHHATGDAWVELELREAEVTRLLSLRRGDHVALRVTSLSGGRARYPMARLLP